MKVLREIWARKALPDLRVPLVRLVPREIWGQWDPEVSQGPLAQSVPQGLWVLRV